MRVAITGATGMVGAGVLSVCLEDRRVTGVVTIGRQATGKGHPKLTERIHSDFLNWPEASHEFAGVDAVFFCLGVSAVGMSEAEYRRITYDFTVATARAYASVRPGGVFCYVSGAGTDSSEQGRRMWARVKGATENALLAMDDVAAYMFRPGYIQPERGVRSKTLLYQAAYTILAPIFPLLERLAPTRVTRTTTVGRAMIEVALHGDEARVLEVADINRLGREPGS